MRKFFEKERVTGHTIKRTNVIDRTAQGADLVFRSKTNSEMNSQHYMEWLTGQLLPVLDKPTVIILDNASYHNKQKDKPPTSNDRKEEMVG